MKNNHLPLPVKNQGLYIAAGIGLLLLLKSRSASAATSIDTYTSPVNLNNLSDYGSAEDLQLLQSLLDELNTRGFTPLQIKLMLAQAMLETGIFTEVGNYDAMINKHNFAGIMHNGVIATYDNLIDFVSDWMRILYMGSNPPLLASSVGDFNSRLKANGYYGSDDSVLYGNNLAKWFNII